MPSVDHEMLVQTRDILLPDHNRNDPIVLIRLARTARADVEPLRCRQWRTLA